LYLGANLGGEWSNFDVSATGSSTTTTLKNSAFIWGGQIGYNYQFYSGLVLGVEFDADWGGGKRASAIVAAPGGNVQVSTEGPQFLSTLAGRVGYGVDRWLVYGKAGGGWLHAEANFSNLTTGATANADRTVTAWMLGAGVEYALDRNWTTKLEYNYLGSGNWSAPDVVFAGGRGTIGGNLQVLKVGLNYKF
jgi:outer membrane immunogenic protein